MDYYTNMDLLHQISRSRKQIHLGLNSPKYHRLDTPMAIPTIQILFPNP